MGHGVSASGTRVPVSERRQAVTALTRSLLVCAALFVAYFSLPMTRVTRNGFLAMVVGMVVAAVLLVWEIRQILRSPHPGLRGVQALVLSASVFFVGFATTYYLMSATSGGSFNEPLTRLDAAYFTMTVLSTVGFGDIVAVTEPARAVTMVQMLADLVLIGVVARILVRAVQVAKERQEEHR